MRIQPKRRFLALLLIVIFAMSVFGMVTSAAEKDTVDLKEHNKLIDDAVKATDPIIKEALAAIDKANAEKTSAMKALTKAEEALEKIEDQNSDAYKAAEDEVKAKEAALDDANAKLDAAINGGFASLDAWAEEYHILFSELDADEGKKPVEARIGTAIDLVKSSFSDYFAAYASANVKPSDDNTAVLDAADAAKKALEDLSALIDESSSQFVDDGPFYATFWALLPPIIAIGLALITKEVYSSLFIGILAGALLQANFSPLGTMDTIINDGLIAAVSGSAGIFIFLVILGIFVALINKTGAAAAFGKWAQKNIKTRVGAQLATFVLGILIFIDDYFNCLTVGSVMKPVTDSHKVSRAKLSFIIDATAAPICMIAPISSWAAAVSEYADGTGIGGFELFIKAIPFNYYSLGMLLFVLLIIVCKADYGPMALHEKNAIEKGDLFTTGVSTNKAKEELEVNEKGKVIDIVIPVIALIVICVFALVYVGGILSGASFIDAFGDTDATVGLPWGALIALVLTIIYLIVRRVITFKDAMECIPKGFNAMVPAILILTFATALKNVTSLLGAADFIDVLMSNAAEALTLFLPAVIFIVACLLAFATGTSWGTFGILIPIVTAMFTIDDPLYIIGMSACLAGAVCGDHCSPISDTTIMSSAGAECDHINHVSTQIPYAVTVAATSFVAYLVGGLTKNGWIGLAVSFILTAGVIFVMKSRKPSANNKKNKQ